MKRGTPDHPKTRALARALQVPLAQAVGTLEMLWQWTARFAPTGAVGRFGSPVIAESCAWTGDPDVLIAAMTAADSRFLDSDDEHGLIVHDWPDHADDMVHRQLARAGTRFANGGMPRLTRLSSEERKQAETAFKKGARRAPKVRPKAHDVRPAVPGRAVAVPGLAKPEPGPQGNDSSAPLVAAAPTDPIAAEEKPWSTEACDLWQHFLGTPPGGRIGKALKPLLGQHGWGTVRDLWRDALEEAVTWDDPGRFTPEVFARSFEVRLRRSKAAPPPPGELVSPRAGPRLLPLTAKDERRRAALSAGIAGGLKGDGTLPGGDQ